MYYVVDEYDGNHVAAGINDTKATWHDKGL